MRLPLGAAAWLGLLALSLPAQALPQGRSSQPPRFVAVVLESPGQPGQIGNEEASAINAKGETAGRVLTGESAQAARWSASGELTVIGTTGGCVFSSAADINGEGVVVGSSVVGAPDNAFVWSPSTGTLQLPLPSKCYPAAIDAHGTIAFTAFPAGWPALGAVWDPGVGMQRLAIPSGEVLLRDRNEAGLVTGLMSVPGVGTQAFRWSFDGGFADLGPAAGFSISHGLGLNEQGVVVGLSRSDFADQATLWRDGLPPTLLPFAHPYSGQSCANAINDAGWVVGYEYESPTSWARTMGVLWIDGIAYDLTRLIEKTPGGPHVHVLVAWDINPSGQIAARGLVDGIERALRLDPL